jgi:O-antigen/teichoic acid export membrane protein
VVPLLILPFTRNLVAVVGVMAAGKLIAWFAYLVLCLRTVPAMRRGFAVRLDVVESLVGFGGWMTVANVINPIMVQMDRFLVGALVSTAAVAYYTTPYELVTKYWFLSNSVVGVMFPAFATSFVQDRSRTALIFGRGVKYVFLILFPLVLVTVALAHEVLTLWIGADFALRSTRVLQCLALGVFLNGLAQVSSALLQGVGRPDLTAILHVVELPFFLVMAWFLISTRGIEGAAMAWTARTALDLVLFFGMARRVLPSSSETVHGLIWALGVTLPVVAVFALPISIAPRVAFLLLVAVAYSVVTWGWALKASEKAPILGACATAWRWVCPDRALAIATALAEAGHTPPLRRTRSG